MDTRITTQSEGVAQMSGKGKVLVMDDEQIILDMTREVLKFLGYDAMFARDGATAIDLYKKEMAAGVPFDIVILDLSVQSGLGGKATIEELQEDRSPGKIRDIKRIYGRSRSPGFLKSWF